MELEIKPTIWKPSDKINWGYELKFLDDWVNYHDKEKYDKRWNVRCSNCLAPCCNFSMNGFRYDYKTDKENPKEMIDFFSYDFVVDQVKYHSHQEDIDMGFKTNLNPPELEKLMLCPLNVLGDCLIYENRPAICKGWRCVMALDTYLGVN